MKGIASLTCFFLIPVGVAFASVGHWELLTGCIAVAAILTMCAGFTLVASAITAASETAEQTEEVVIETSETEIVTNGAE